MMFEVFFWYIFLIVAVGTFGWIAYDRHVSRNTTCAAPNTFFDPCFLTAFPVIRRSCRSHPPATTSPFFRRDLRIRRCARRWSMSGISVIPCRGQESPPNKATRLENEGAWHDWRKRFRGTRIRIGNRGNRTASPVRVRGPRTLQAHEFGKMNALTQLG